MTVGTLDFDYASMKEHESYNYGTSLFNSLHVCHDANQHQLFYRNFDRVVLEAQRSRSQSTLLT